MAQTDCYTNFVHELTSYGGFSILWLRFAQTESEQNPAYKLPPKGTTRISVQIVPFAFYKDEVGILSF